MNLLSCAPFWPIQDGLPDTYPALAGSVRADVAVLGAGVSGALAALHLAAAGLDVVVIDRRDVAHGSTAGSTSLLQYEIDVPLRELSKRYGTRFAERCYRRCSDAVDSVERLVKRHRLDCSFERKRSLMLAARHGDVGDLRLEYLARRRAGFSVAWWDQVRIARESSLPHRAGIWSAQGAQLDAYAFTYGLLKAAARLGARIFDRTAVRQTRWNARGVRLATPAGTVTARHLVCATGYEADALLIQRRTKLRSTYALVTEPVGAHRGWPARDCLIWETGDRYRYLRCTGDGRVLIGGGDEPFRDPTHRDRLLPAKRRYLEATLRRWFPQLVAPTAWAWAGTFACTSDGLPWIGRHPRNPRLWLALGYGGNGITFSLLAAELIRDGICGLSNQDVALFGMERASKC